MSSHPPATALPSPDRPRRRRWITRVLLVLGTLLLVLAVAAGGGGLWLRSRLVASLPRIEGEIKVEGPGGPVRVERDALGVPTIRGADRNDVAFATGFVHAQDRFFQMDLMRRRAAGELAELVGKAALPLDRGTRLHRFRARAREVVAATESDEGALLGFYARGVNAGLADLGSKPWEYLALRTEPALWKAEDSVLILYAMYLDLQDDQGGYESGRGLIHDLLPGPLAEFLTPRGTAWDAALEGEVLPTPPVPEPEDIDLRYELRNPVDLASLGQPLPREVGASIDAPVPGSNNWAVSGTRAAEGGALLANDMHLGLSMPNIWYRASLVWPDPDWPGGEHRVTGVTLPGAPLVVAGSNGRVAWGYTNNYGDWCDLVILETDPDDPTSYRTPEGLRKMERHRETLRVKGGAEETLELRETIWGPLIDPDHEGRPRAQRWVAHDAEAVNLRLLGMEEVAGVDEALALAGSCGIPAQNLVLADDSGRIAWTTIGRIPRRFGHEGRLPSSWADGSRGWDGWLSPEEQPRVVDPPEGRLWTANARVASGDALALLGDGGYPLGARAKQIRDALREIERATELNMLAVQLDDRALFLERWRDLLLHTLSQPGPSDGPRAQLELAVRSWGARATVDSAGYRMVRAFRLYTIERVFEPLVAPLGKASPGFRYQDRQLEGPLWAILSERPLHLLDPRHESWNALLLEAADAVIERFGTGLLQQTWGARNTVTIRHPLSRALPFLSRWLDLPATQLPGDSHMPRVQSVGYGASERFVVSPGREEKGLFHMPGGQSGHPLSPHYRDGHEAWEKGEPTPFLPGPPLHTLVLTPSNYTANTEE